MNKDEHYQNLKKALYSVTHVHFTAREIDIITCQLSGRTTSDDIASFLSIESKTVESHKSNYRNKLGGRNVRDLVESSNNRDDLKSALAKHYSYILGQEHCFRQKLRAIKNKSVSLVLKIYYAKDQDSEHLIDDKLKHGKLIQHLAFLQCQVDVENIRPISELTIDNDTTNRPLSKFSTEEQVLGTYGAQNRSVHLVREDSSTGATRQLPSVVEFRKRSNVDFIIFVLSPAFIKFLEDNKYTLDEYIKLLLPKNTSKIIYLRQYNTSDITYNGAFAQIAQIDFYQNYHRAFFELLSTLMPKLSYDAQKYIEELDQKHQKKSSDVISASAISVVSSAFIEAAPVMRHYKILLLLTISLILAMLSLYNTHAATSNHGEAIIKADLTLPIDSMLLNRETIIEEIDAKFKDSIGSSSTQVLALVGIGGTGKTTLARTYAILQKADIIWEINAETPEAIVSSFEDFAQVLAQTDADKKELRWIMEIKNLEVRQNQILGFVKSKLRLRPNWVLIYDNVTTIHDCIKYLPGSAEKPCIGKIIITTRDGNIANTSYVHHVLHIGELSFDQKQTLFLKILNRPLSKLAPQNTEILSFLDAIPPFPLDISIAAKYIVTTNISFEKYLEHLRDNTYKFHEVQQSILQEEENYSETRYALISSSVQQLLNINEHFSSLLLLVVLLDSQNIARDLLEHQQNSLVVDDFLRNLKRFSFITSESSYISGAAFSIHRSTQSNTLSYLIQKLDLMKKPELLQAIIKSFGGYIDNAIEKEDLQKMRLLLPHCEALLRTNKGLLTDEMIGYIEGKLGIIYYYLSYNSNASAMLSSSIPKLETNYNSHYEDIAKNLIYFSLSTLYTTGHDNGQGSEMLLKKSLAIYQKHFDKNNPNIADVLIHLGRIEVKRNNFTKAKELLERGLSIYMTNPSKYHLKTAWALRSLGKMHRDRGNYIEAKFCLEKSVAIYTEHSTEQNPKIYASYVRLAQVYRDLGEYHQSKALLVKAVDFSNEYYGERRPWSWLHLARTQEKLGEYKEAQSLYIKSLNHYTAYFPHEHTKVVWSSVNLGNLYSKMGDYEKALPLLKRSLEIQQKQFGLDNIGTARILVHLGNIYTHLAEYTKSAECLEHGIAIYKKSFSENHIMLGEVLVKIGENYMYSGNYAKAQTLLENSLMIYENHYGRDHIDTARVLASLGYNHSMQEGLEAAERFLNKAHAIFQRDNHPDIYLVLEFLADLNLRKAKTEKSLGRHKEAKKLQNIAVAQLKQALNVITTSFSDPSTSVYAIRIKSQLSQI